jgi:hypothetical protein
MRIQSFYSGLCWLVFLWIAVQVGLPAAAAAAAEAFVADQSVS